MKSSSISGQNLYCWYQQAKKLRSLLVTKNWKPQFLRQQSWGSSLLSTESQQFMQNLRQ